jgi:hypothetical protein
MIVQEHESLSFGREPMQLGIDGRIDVPAGIPAVRVGLSSTTALHLRSAWRFADDADYTVTVFADGDLQQPLVNGTGSAMNGDRQSVWSAITTGDSQEVLITRLSADAGPWDVALERVAHFDHSLHPKLYDITPKALGDSAYCQTDIACVLDLVTPSQQQTVLAASRAVAFMFMIGASGPWVLAWKRWRASSPPRRSGWPT